MASQGVAPGKGDQPQQDEAADDFIEDNISGPETSKDADTDDKQIEDIPFDENDESNDTISNLNGRPYERAPIVRHYNFAEREAMRMARNPCLYFWISFVSSLAIGVIGMITGNFQVAADNDGWNSRGTLIADRQTQLSLVQNFQMDLFSDTNGETWRQLVNNVQKWEGDDDDDRRRLQAPSGQRSNVNNHISQMLLPMTRHSLSDTGETTVGDDVHYRKSFLPTFSGNHIRLLQNLNSTEGTLLEGCDISWYTSESMYSGAHLWPVWKTKRGETSFFDSDLLKELCLEEQKTQSYLEKQGLCQRCEGSKRCLQPYSTVFYARLTVSGGMSMSCEELAAAWKADGQEDTHKNSLDSCVEDLLAYYTVDRDGANLPDTCPYGFFPTILDELYPSTELAKYSSTIFATPVGIAEALYDGVDNYARGQSKISGAYDTQYEDFVNLSLDEQLLMDMSLAVGSAFVTVIAMVIHTRSPFLSIVGLAQIVFSFPLAFFFYTFVAQMDFFPFLNFIGIFVIFALGADDVFVAVDKWKNARLKHPNASVEEIAAVALPDAAMSMFLTTITTAVAFFGTAVCPVAPILCFAVFVGLLVVLDYILCVLLVFPALCIYDQADHSRQCCCHCKLMSTCKCCKEEPDEVDVIGQTEVGDESGFSLNGSHRYQRKTPKSHVEGVMKEGFIHKTMRSYYQIMYKVRWPLVVVCVGSLVWCSIVAAKIGLPSSSDVRLYNEDDNQFEQNFVWRKKLLFDVLEKKAGSEAYVIWGVSPADTGNQNNPNEWSQLVLDPTFNPSDTEAQEYLLGFCNRFFVEEFVEETSESFVCPINSFNKWLGDQSASASPTLTYIQNCNGATGLPMPPEDFHGCMYNWSQLVNEYSVLARQGKITIMFIPFTSRVRYDSPYDELNSEWELLEDWMNTDQQNAPSSANNQYFTSEDFWWFDTNRSMLRTAFQAAGIAMGAAAAVILFSSRSVVMTIFATISVGYVLTSVTAMLVAFGWELGFIESILFAILIGVSCDFVIHFSHAYAHMKGHRTREERTLHALLSMGPSILAAAFTTFSAALVMLFTVIIFFEKFAVVLFLTVVQALIGSFVVFLVIALCFGPSNPTYLVDKLMAICCSSNGGEGSEAQEDDKVQDDGSSEVIADENTQTKEEDDEVQK